MKQTGWKKFFGTFMAVILILSSAPVMDAAAYGGETGFAEDQITEDKTRENSDPTTDSGTDNSEADDAVSVGNEDETDPEKEDRANS